MIFYFTIVVLLSLAIYVIVKLSSSVCKGFYGIDENHDRSGLQLLVFGVKNEMWKNKVVKNPYRKSTSLLQIQKKPYTFTNC